MQAIERFLKGKHDDASRCEDGIIVTPHFAAVVDGSTSKVPGRAGGRLAMQLTIEAIATLPPDCTKEEMLRRLTEALATPTASPPPAPLSGGRGGSSYGLKHSPTSLFVRGCSSVALGSAERISRPLSSPIKVTTPPSPPGEGGQGGRGCCEAALRPTCSLVLFSRHRRVVWQVGDCLCRFGGHTYTHPKRVDAVLIRARCDATRHLLAHGWSEADILRADPGRALILPALREQTNFQNDPNPLNPFRYPVLDGTPVDPALVPERPVPPGVHRLILASDGYPELHDTLAQSEAALARLLRLDPLCIRENAATKCLRPGQCSFDDRAFLSLEI